MMNLLYEYPLFCCSLLRLIARKLDWRRSWIEWYLLIYFYRTTRKGSSFLLWKPFDRKIVKFEKWSLIVRAISFLFYFFFLFFSMVIQNWTSSLSRNLDISKRGGEVKKAFTSFVEAITECERVFTKRRKLAASLVYNAKADNWKLPFLLLHDMRPCFLRLLFCAS